MLVIGLLLTGMIACSDLEEGGVIRSEVDDAQANIQNAPSGQQQLFIIQKHRRLNF